MVLKLSARIDGDTYANAIDGKVQIAEGATIGGSNSTFSDSDNRNSMRGMHQNSFSATYSFHPVLRILSAIVGEHLTLLREKGQFTNQTGLRE